VIVYETDCLIFTVQMFSINDDTVLKNMALDYN
jgi:hypothetical protein